MAKTKPKLDKNTPRIGYEFLVPCAACGEELPYTDNGIEDDDEWECTEGEPWIGYDNKNNELIFCSETCIAEYFGSRDDCMGHTAKDLKKIGGRVGEKVAYG